MSVRGFTLIELLASVALGVALIAMAWAGMYQGRQVILRTIARTELHQQAATIRGNLAQEAGDLHPGCAIHLQAGTDAMGLRFLELTWMGSLANPERYGFVAGAYQGHRSPMMWTRWRWEAPAGAAHGRLLHARSSEIRKVDFGGGQFVANYSDGGSFGTFPAPRRDHRRPLDDNDFSLLDNFTLTKFHSQRPPGRNSLMVGDGSDLDGLLSPVHPRVAGWTLAWVGPDGGVLAQLREADCAAGFTGGFDGLWLDARDPALLRTRPVLLRVSFTLIDAKAPAGIAASGDSLTLRQAFGFSLPLAGQDTAAP